MNADVNRRRAAARRHLAGRLGATAPAAVPQGGGAGTRALLRAVARPRSAQLTRFVEGC
jgi:hypothetical protein